MRPFATFAGGWCLNLPKDTVYLNRMKRLAKIVVCVASGLVLNAGARADDGVLPNNPYAPVVVRNMFGLNPLPTNDVNASQVDPPPKITPNGIMSIFGQLQVLYKVALPAKPPEQAARDVPYILSEGQRQDDIEVVQIDEKNGLVTFNNHGTVQELPLVKASAPAGSPSTPGPGRAVAIQSGLTAPSANNNSGNNSGRGPIHFGSRTSGGAGAARNGGTGAGGNNFNSGLGGGAPMSTVPMGGGYPGQSSQQPQNTLTAEEQAVLIEANRMVTQDLVDQGRMPPLPPTLLTPGDATGHHGTPLITPPPPPP